MKLVKTLLILSAVLLSASAADAGPLRRIAARVTRPTCQPAPVPALQNRPLANAVGNVVQAVAQVPQATMQAVGQLVLPTARGTTCSGGVCR